MGPSRTFRRLARLRVLLVALAAGVLAGCVTPPPEEPGTVGAALIPCSTDAECASAGLICDPLRRNCVCTSDAMCAGSPARPFCNAFTGQCVAEVAGCRSDAECETGEYCDIARRTCRLRRNFCEPCAYDLECGGAGDLCVRASDSPTAPSFCATACRADGSCPTGQECRESGRGRQCYPAGGRCGASFGCNPDSGQSCGVDGHCTLGHDQVCDLTRCAARESGCAVGQACDPSTRQCVLACEGERDCVERFGPGHFCHDKVCLRAQVCLADTGCPEGEWCLKPPGSEGPEDPGSCVSSCIVDRDCPVGNRCLPAGENRYRCQPGCLGSDDCPLNAICSGGVCKTTDAQGRRHCQTREVCDYLQSCIGNVCISPTNNKHCTPCGGGCGSGRCESLFARLTCDPSLQCPVGTTRQPFPDPACSSGYAYGCYFQRCVQLCGSHDDCPKGFGCQSFLNASYCFPSNADSCL